MRVDTLGCGSRLVCNGNARKPAVIDRADDEFIAYTDISAVWLQASRRQTPSQPSAWTWSAKAAPWPPPWTA